MGIRYNAIDREVRQKFKNRFEHYAGAKPHFLIVDRIDDKDWLCKLITITAEEWPEPKMKKLKYTR